MQVHEQEVKENKELHNRVLAMQAQITFKNNMQYFKLRNPSLYNFFKNYQPQKFQLFIDDAGYLNIQENGNPICQDDPETIAKEQVELFRSRREVLRSDFSSKRVKPEETRFEHTQTMNALTDELTNFREVRSRHSDLPEHITLIVILGVGFGHHISELIRLRDIRSLFLFEPEPDVFYASLHTLDWVEVMEHFEPEGRSLDIKIGGDAEGFCNHIVRSVVSVGVYRISWIYLYRSAESEIIQKSYSLLKKNIHRIAQGWGFFDDELISVAHGAANAVQSRNWLQRNMDLELYKDIPVFIIGSGPSVDEHLDFIRENKDKALIFCGGTALKTLKAAGIEPDFHVEVERIYAAYELLSETLADGDFGKDTILLANNTVHPQVFDLFQRAGIAQKVNDAGSTLMSKLFKVPMENQLDWGKPSCINGALVFSCMLGFSNIYMFGCDCGFKDSKSHHSKKSDYFDDEGNDKRNYDKDYEQNIEVEGNFGGTILSTAYLDMGRMTLEQAKAQYPHVNAFNCSDGATIKGFTPLKVQDLRLDKDISEKAALKSAVLERHFHQHQCDEELLSAEYKAAMVSFHNILDRLREPLETPPKSSKDAMDKLMAMDKVLTDRMLIENELAFKLLNGSLRTFQTMMAVIAQESPDPVVTEEYFVNCSKHFLAFVEKMRDMTTNRFPKLDDYSWDHVRNRAKLEKESVA